MFGWTSPLDRFLGISISICLFRCPTPPFWYNWKHYLMVALQVFGSVGWRLAIYGPWAIFAPWSHYIWPAELGLQWLLTEGSSLSCVVPQLGSKEKRWYWRLLGPSTSFPWIWAGPFWPATSDLGFRVLASEHVQSRVKGDASPCQRKLKPWRLQSRVWSKCSLECHISKVLDVSGASLGHAVFLYSG